MEPKTIIFSKALIETNTALDTYIETVKLETMYTTPNFKPWKEKVLTMVKEKVAELK